ncbi:hypothetical protein [Jiangella asiatica]|uniref:Uncharacterized protein n=1 Tax=Jiangella asiatica TaxID=2530372 RepID=A0A4R5CQL5_9ACTN|nr:hypothetical protein [Jiangella asiatica]TDE02812.1 hypothetical protein E1269_21205 [Jiangella asiatica]
MRDIRVAFIEDPNPNERIVELRQQIVERHSVMFESIVDVGDLKQKLAVRLESWETLAGTKIPRHVDLLSSSGKMCCGPRTNDYGARSSSTSGSPTLGARRWRRLRLWAARSSSWHTRGSSAGTAT